MMSDKANIKQPQVMTEAAWRELGEQLFGADLASWRFRCPTCENVMSITKVHGLSDADKAKLRAAGWVIEQECIGRYLDGHGCDWCAYGLFKGPFFVMREDRKTPVFGFDTGAPT